jgi:hypothetical protein
MPQGLLLPKTHTFYADRLLRQTATIRRPHAVLVTVVEEMQDALPPNGLGISVLPHAVQPVPTATTDQAVAVRIDKHLLESLWWFALLGPHAIIPFPARVTVVASAGRAKGTGRGMRGPADNDQRRVKWPDSEMLA